MRTNQINIPVNECLENDVITFKVTGVKKFTLRLKIAMLFIRAAAWVMPIKTDVKIEP